jgi:multiple sugar transport system permease protein
LKLIDSSTRLPTTKIALFTLTAVLALLTVFPLMWMVSGAFKSPGQVFDPNPIPAPPTIENFTSVFARVSFLRYMLNTFFVAGTVTVVALWFHSMAAYALARLRFPGRDVVFFAIFSTLLVALPVILVPLFILVREMGVINSYAGLIIPPIFNAFGIFLLRQFYLSMPRELEDAARVDGCGYWGVYWHVILPLSRPMLAALAVFFFLANWNSFLWPLTITLDQDLWMIQVAIASFQTQYAGAWNLIMAAATVAAIPTMALFFVFQRQLVESIKTSGFK